ncbi:sigma factor-like helix-turn-helix DNA-binding protein [Streptomyces sp. NPDC001135]
MTSRASRRPSHRPGRRPEFGGYAAMAWPRLLRTAQLLTGEPAEADALARAALSDAYARWRRIPGNDTDFYVRRLLVRRHLRRRSRGRGSGPDAALARALAALPARQRVVLVLRLGEDLGRLEIAEMLGWSVGAVKWYERRGLKALGAA